MEFIKTVWTVSVNYSKVTVVGRAPLCNKIIGRFLKSAMISKAVELIEMAEQTGACVVLSESPKDLTVSNENKLEIHFSIMFQNHETANQYARSIKA